MNFWYLLVKKTYERTQADLNLNNMDTNVEERQPLNPNIIILFFKPAPIDCNTIILTIKSPKDSHSYSSDGIPFCFIRDSLPVIVFYVMVIVNSSIVSNAYPNIWKIPM